MNENCQKCGVDTEGDFRSILMKCAYSMEELGLPFHQDDEDGYYKLIVCKRCRAEWMKAIKAWFETPVDNNSPGSGIYVRHLGFSKEVSQDEYARMQQGKS